MRFTEAYGDWQQDRLTQEEAALILGVSDRTFRRYIDRYEESGLEGIADKRLTHTVEPRWMKLWRLLIFTAAIIWAGMPGTSTIGTANKVAVVAIPGSRISYNRQS